MSFVSLGTVPSAALGSWHVRTVSIPYFLKPVPYCRRRRARLGNADARRIVGDWTLSRFLLSHSLILPISYSSAVQACDDGIWPQCIGGSRILNYGSHSGLLSLRWGLSNQVNAGPLAGSIE